MREKLKIFVFTLLCVPLVAVANAEMDAFQACRDYNVRANQYGASPLPVPCQLNNRNAEQLHCLMKKRFDEKWAFSEAAKFCLNDTPALPAFSQYEQRLSQVEPRIICEEATKAFGLVEPKEKIEFFYSLCKNPERTSVQWYCMEYFAKDGNSFNFSAGQCFPQKPAG